MRALRILTILAFVPVGASLAQPATLDRIVAARTAYDRQDWVAAIPLLEKLVAENPENGDYRVMLARSRFLSKDYAKAASDYAQALALGGFDPAVLEFHIAQCNAWLGKRGETLHWLTLAMSHGYRDLASAGSDPAFAMLKAQPEFAKLLGIAPPNLSRDEGWRYDIDFLAGQIEHRSYHPFKTFTGDRNASGALYTQTEFEEQIARLGSDVPKLTDRAIELRVMGLVASLGDGHTSVWGARRPEFALTLPLAFYEFTDGLYIVATAPQYKDLMGAKVIAFDSTPANDALAKLDPYIAHDNSQWFKAMEPQVVRHVPFLQETGVTKSDSAVDLTIVDSNGVRRTVHVTADMTQPDIWNMLPKPAGWAWIGDKGSAEFQQRNNENYWMAWHPDTGILYVQYNKIEDAKDQTLAQFVQTLAQEIAQQPVRKLVIDMRNNNGGNTFLNEPMLKAIAGNRKVDVTGRLYVIIGRRTFSAAMNAVSYFGRYTKAIFVGEPTGGKPNAPGDEVPIALPYSGIVLNLSDRYWQGGWPDDFSPWRAPDIAVPVTFADYANGRDAAMAAIMAQPLPQ